MVETASSPSFNTRFDARTGESVEIAPGIHRVTAPNAGPFTFKGTNTFILGTRRLTVVDPGPENDSHFAALMRVCGDKPVEAILLTHTHRDHSALAPRLREVTGAPIWFGGRHRPSRQRRRFERDWVRRESDYALTPDRELADNEILDVGDMHVEVIGTPGHCANHLCFGIAGTPDLLSGDHVMGWNSTMIAVPDGSMADYLDSLRRVIALPYRRFHPAHGGPVEEGPAFSNALRQHREGRNNQIVQAVNAGARSIGDLRRTMYPNLAMALIPAARMTLSAHVEYLADQGKIRVRRGILGPVISPA